MAPASDVEVVEAAGHEVRITSPSKVFFPERGETKLDLVRSYLAIEDSLMRTMGGRPVLRQRFPEGAGGPNFFQKRVPKEIPDWLQTTTVSTVNGTANATTINELMVYRGMSTRSKARSKLPHASGDGISSGERGGGRPDFRSEPLSMK